MLMQNLTVIIPIDAMPPDSPVFTCLQPHIVTSDALIQKLGIIIAIELRVLLTTQQTFRSIRGLPHCNFLLGGLIYIFTLTTLNATFLLVGASFGRSGNASALEAGTGYE